LFLVILVLVLALARLRSYAEPMEWDVGTYATAAREIRFGEWLYADAWDVKPPAIFATYVLAQTVAGDGHLHVYLLSVLAAVATMLGVWRAASVASPAAGAWAAAFYVAMCYEPWTGANLPNTEAFLNACVAWSFALWVWGDRATSWRRWVAIGLLFATASLYKQVAVAPAAVLAAGELAFARDRRRAVANIAVAAVAGALAWSAVLAYFAATGRGWLIVQTLFVASSAYSGNIAQNVAASLRPAQLFPPVLAFAIPVAVLALVGVIAWRRSAPRDAWRRWAALAIGTHLAIALPGHFATHYEQLWFVPLAIGAGRGAAAIPRLLPPRRQVLGYAAAGLALLVVIMPQLSWYAEPGDRWALRKHGPLFVWANGAAREADQMLLPTEGFYTWSDEAWAYALAHRRAPGPALWAYHATTGPMAPWLTRQTLANLQRHPPELIAVWGTSPQPADHPIPRWIVATYDPLPDPQRRRFPLSFWVRKGGPLRQRLTSAALD
jgi:4-amino-4-deoxy-L-arabinose transferase-like glycosyltransferase